MYVHTFTPGQFIVVTRTCGSVFSAKIVFQAYTGSRGEKSRNKGRKSSVGSICEMVKCACSARCLVESNFSTGDASYENGEPVKILTPRYPQSKSSVGGGGRGGGVEALLLRNLLHLGSEKGKDSRSSSRFSETNRERLTVILHYTHEYGLY